MSILTVYVPAKTSIYRHYYIKAGSAIVGTQVGADLVMLDYEGNLYNASNLHSYHDRLLQAAYRHVEKYPTVARMCVDLKEVQAVGTLDMETKKAEITDLEALCEWQEQK